MELKKGLEVSTDDFWYDLTYGGYLKPEEMCANPRDAERVNAAIALLQEFQQACEKEGLIQ